MSVPKRRRGFTLIELLIVIAIISLLIAMIIQTMGPIRRTIEHAQCQTKLKGLLNAYTSYVNRDARGVFPALHTIASKIQSNPENIQGDCNVTPQNAFLVMIAGDFSAGWGPLIWHGLIKDSDDLLCPVILDKGFQWWHTSVLPANDENLWTASYVNPDSIVSRENLFKGLPKANTSSRASYDIRPGLVARGIDKVQQLGMRALIADNLAVPDCILERHGTGVNVGYIDGSAMWVEDERLWNNALTWSFVLNDPRSLALWKILDDAKD